MSDHRYLHLVRSDCPLPRGAHVVAYCRDSGGEEQDRSVQQQVETVREYCEHHGLVLDRIYTDEARTASNSEKRDQLNQMLIDLRYRFGEIRDRYKRDKEAREHPFGVIFWKSNRLSRDHVETTFIKADLRMRALTIIDLVTHADTGDPGTNALLEAFQQWQDQNLLDEISQNAKRGLAELVSLRDNDPSFREYNPDWPTNDGRYLGIMPGKLPTGFRAERIQIGMRERKRRNGTSREPHIVQRAVPDHENDLWERCYLAWKMRHEGAPIKAIIAATHIYKSAGSYTTFFKNRIYTGDYAYGGQLYRAFVPALIPVEWWEAEQERIRQRARKLQGRKLHAGLEPRRVGSRHLLSGLLYCGHVPGEEHPMYGDTIPAKEGKRTQWDFYMCSVKKNTRSQDCDSGRIGAKAIDEAVIDSLMDDVLTVENLRPIADKIAESLSDQNASVLERITALEGHLDEVRTGIDKLMDAVEKMGMSPNLQKRLMDREADERDLIAQIANLEDMLVKPEEIPEITTEQLEGFLADIRATLLSDDVELARRALRRFVAKIVVANKKGTIYYTFPLSDLSRKRTLPPRGLEHIPLLLLDTTTKYYLKWLYDNVPPPSPPRGNKRPSKDKRNAEMLKLYKEGMPIKSIAQRFGVSYQRVWQVVKERE